MQIKIILSYLFLFIAGYLKAQNIGIKLPASTPANTTLDVNGSAAYREGTALSLSNGVNSNITLGDFSFFRITGPTAAFSITGFTGGQDGRVLTLINATSQVMTLTHQATSTSANQINTGGTNLTVAANGVAVFIYNSILTKWVVSGGQGFTNTAWNVTGNSGTNTTTNFIGTTDAQGLRFKTNNANSILLNVDARGGNMSISHLRSGSPWTSSLGYGGISYPTDIDTSFGIRGGIGADDFFRIGGVVKTNSIGTDGELHIITGDDGNEPIIFEHYQTGVGTYTERMRIHGNGNVGIGVNSPGAKLSVSNNATIASVPNDVIAHFTNADATDTEVHIDTYGNGATDDPALVFRRAAGTAAAPLALRSGDYMGRLTWWGHNGTAFVDQSAKLEVSAAENWTSSSNATRMEFQTTPSGATVPVRYMVLSSAGNLGIGLAPLVDPLSTAKLHVETTGTNHAVYAPIGTNYNYFAGKTAMGRATSNPTTTFLGTNADAFLHLQDSVTSIGSSVVEGLGVKLKVVPSASTTGALYGINSRVHTAAYNSSNVSTLESGNFDFRHYGTGTVDYGYGIIARSVNLGTGRIVRSYGILVDCGNFTGATTDSLYGISITGGQFGTLTNATYGVGLHIVDVAATNAYGIFQTSSNDKNRFEGDVSVGGVDPSSKLDVNGSFAAAIATTSSNLTLDATHHTVIITGGTPAITLPTASTCSRRMYVIVNHTAAPRTISSYLNFSGAGTTSVPANSSITVQSNGTSWYRIQ
jgi:hypothetical protein